MTRIKTNVKNVKGKFSLTPATTIQVNKKYVHKSYGVVEVRSMSIHGTWDIKAWDGQILDAEDDELYEIYFISITKDNIISPLKNTQYNQVFNKGYIESQGIVDCVHNSPIFDISGKSYSKECINCHAWFDAAKKQLHCQSCNEVRHYIELDKKAAAKSKNKRVTYNMFVKLLSDIYLEGVKRDHSFDLSAYVDEKFKNL